MGWYFRILTVLALTSLVSWPATAQEDPVAGGTAAVEATETVDNPDAAGEGTGTVGAGSVEPGAGASATSGGTEKKTGLISPWDLHPALEGGLLLGSAIMLVIEPGFSHLNRGPWCGLSCDPASVNPLDRTVIGWYNRDAALASDITLGISIGLPLLAQAIDTAVTKPADGWRGYGKDVMVLAETLALTAGFTNFLKFAVGRARPYAYLDSLPDDVRTEKDAGLSFPSGHTSMAFAMATSWSWLYMKRHPDSPAVVPIWVGSYAIATTTALLRPVAGKHFWTDIIAGAAIGVGVGLLVPYLHELVAKKNRASKDTRIIVSPTVVEGGGGAVVTIVQ